MNKKTPRGLQPSRRELMAMLAAGLTLDAAPGMAQAQSWPSGSGKVIVGFVPGSSTDNFARGCASHFQDEFHQPFVVENRAGAGGWPATLFVSQAKPDGLTLTFNANGITVYGLIQKNGFDSSVDLTPIAMVAKAPVAILVPGTLPVKNITEFVAYCKAHADQVFFGSAGVGSINHLYGELFNQRAGIHMKHVAYRGFNEEVPDLLANRIQASFASYGTAAGLVNNGQLKLLAYGGDARPEGTFAAPSVKESGIDYDVSFWWGLFGPKGMSADLQKKINASVNEALKTDAMGKMIKSFGVVADPLTPGEFSAIVKKDTDVLTTLVKTANLQL